MSSVNTNTLNDILRSTISCSSNVELQTRLYKMIDYAIGRHDWYENQRNRFATIALTTLGFAAAFLVGVNDSAKFALSFRICGTVFSFSVIATAVWVLSLYLGVSEKNHPYRKLGSGLID